MLELSWRYIGLQSLELAATLTTCLENRGEASVESKAENDKRISDACAGKYEYTRWIAFLQSKIQRTDQGRHSHLIPIAKSTNRHEISQQFPEIQSMVWQRPYEVRVWLLKVCKR